MDLRHLQTFAAVVESRSFTSAAKILSITQPAVSHHIARLQQELRCALFHRQGRGVLPTKAGEILYSHARRLFDLLAEARLAITGLETTMCGTLKIGACSIAAESLLPSMLDRFHQRHPHVKAQLTVGSSREAVRAVETGRVDLAVVVEVPETRELTAQPIASEEWVLAVAPGHVLASKRTASISQLGNESLIWREPESATRNFIEQALRRSAAMTNLPVTIEMNCDEAIRAAIEQGLGIGFLPSGAIRDGLTAGRLVAIRLTDLPLRLPLYLVTNPHHPRSAATEACIQLLQP